MNGLIIDGKVYVRTLGVAGCRECDLCESCMDCTVGHGYCVIEYPNVNKRETYNYRYSPELTDKLNGKDNDNPQTS